MFKNFKDNFEKFLISFILFFIGFITLVSLITYNQKDNSFFNYDSNIQDSSNILGAFGSYLSSFLIDIFGIISFFIPVFFIFHSLGMLFGKLITWYNWTLLPFLLIFSTLLAEFISQNYIGNSLSAGLLGIGLYNYLSYFLEEFWNPLIILFVLLIFTTVSIYFSLNIKANQITKITNFVYKCLIFIVFSFAKFFNFGKKVKLDKIFTSPQKKPSLSSKTNSTSAGKKKKLSLDFNFPSIELLEKPKKTPGVEIENRRNTEVNGALLANVLRDFKINGEITEVKQGPIVTLFELTPAPGTQSSSVIRLSDDIARSMRANSARISTIPGKDALGIEIPNKNRETVYLRELLDDDLYKSANCKLPLALGKDIFGRPVIVDLAKMPHLLVAGTTGSGKSVGINAMLLSILYQLTPEECRLILVKLYKNKPTKPEKS